MGQDARGTVCNLLHREFELLKAYLYREFTATSFITFGVKGQ